jgi:colanic acid biosynthesis glycosyl transferase WcaI
VRRCGVVVPPERPDLLADAIRELADDPARREALGHAARRHAEDHLARDAILAEWESAARALLEEPDSVCYPPARSHRP